jgi:putative peptidoglycan lipid II flippase
MRLIVPASMSYGFSGILQAYHYSRKRFVYPAMGAPAHNLGVILAVVLLAGKLDIASLSVGIVVAATSQLLVQLPGLRGTRLTLNLNWRHPAIRRILRLYAPVVLSIVIQNIGIIIDRNLASRTVNVGIHGHFFGRIAHALADRRPQGARSLQAYL